jgi:hypothetical protein
MLKKLILGRKVLKNAQNGSGSPIGEVVRGGWPEMKTASPKGFKIDSRGHRVNP